MLNMNMTVQFQEINTLVLEFCGIQYLGIWMIFEFTQKEKINIYSLFLNGILDNESPTCLC